jgi:hypothetical protein
MSMFKEYPVEKFVIIFIALFFLVGCNTWTQGDSAYLLNDNEIEPVVQQCETEICISTADPLMTSARVKILDVDEPQRRALVTRENYYYHASVDAWVSYDHLGTIDGWIDVVDWSGPKGFAACSSSGGCFKWLFESSGRFILKRKSIDDEDCADFEEQKLGYCHSFGRMQSQGRLMSLLVETGERAEFFVRVSSNKYCWLEESYESNSKNCFVIK